MNYTFENNALKTVQAKFMTVYIVNGKYVLVHIFILHATLSPTIQSTYLTYIAIQWFFVEGQAEKIVSPRTVTLNPIFIIVCFHFKHERGVIRIESKSCIYICTEKITQKFVIVIV